VGAKGGEFRGRREFDFMNNECYDDGSGVEMELEGLPQLI
jgi:hypothetical protein